MCLNELPPSPSCLTNTPDRPAPAQPNETELTATSLPLPPSLTLHHLSLSSPLSVSHDDTYDSGLRGRQTDLCEAMCPLQTATQSSHCVEAILDTPVSYPRLVIPYTHSSQSRIVTIVWLLRAAWHQLGPVSTHTGAIISQLLDIRMNWVLVITVAGSGSHLHHHVNL